MAACYGVNSIVSYDDDVKVMAVVMMLALDEGNSISKRKQ
jgi:hypothetical protein